MMGVNTARKSSASSAECKGQRHKSCHPADLLEPGKSPASISFAVEQMNAVTMPPSCLIVGDAGVAYAPLVLWFASRQKHARWSPTSVACECTA